MEIFLSHSHKDKNLAIQMKRFLETYGENVNVFCSADDDINLGEDFNKRIFEGIEKADIFIPLLTKHFRSSSYCLSEFGMAATFAFKGSVDILPVCIYPMKPRDAVAETPLAFLECYDLGNPKAIEYIVSRINHNNTLTEYHIKQFAYNVHKNAVVKEGILNRVDDILSCAWGNDVIVKDWSDFVSFTKDNKGEIAVRFNLNPYELDKPGKLDFISLVLKFYESLDLYTITNYSKKAKIVFEIVNFTNSVNELCVEIKYSHGRIIKKPIGFELQKGTNKCEIPLIEYKVEPLQHVDEICFVVHPDNLNEIEGTFIIKGIDINLPEDRSQ